MALRVKMYESISNNFSSYIFKIYFILHRNKNIFLLFQIGTKIYSIWISHFSMWFSHYRYIHRIFSSFRCICFFIIFISFLFLDILLGKKKYYKNCFFLCIWKILKNQIYVYIISSDIGFNFINFMFHKNTFKIWLRVMYFLITMLWVWWLF